MTTTELYSGYGGDGKPSSRVLRPPGGASSNIFGGPEPTPQQQVRQEMPPPGQGQYQQSPGSQSQNPTEDAKHEYQKNKPSGQAEAPFAMFSQSGKNSAPSQFDKCDDQESQNGADFRSYSVTEYRNAVATNAAVRQRAHGQAMGSFNPITHEEYQGSSPYKEYEQRRPHPQQVAQHQQQQQQQPVRMVRGQGNHDSGKVKFNPITGEEYPADYGQKNKNPEDQEEQEKDETEESEKDNDDAETSNTPDKNNSSTEKTAESQASASQTPPAPIQKVRQPPGGKSSGLW